MEDFFYFQIFLTTVVTVPLVYHWESVCNRLIDYAFKYPGVGNISIVKKGKKRNAIVPTTLGTFKIPFYKLPCLEMDVNFFIDIENVIDKNVMLPREEFRERYGENSYATLRRIDTGIVSDIVKCEDFLNKKEIFGFIDNLFEDKIFVFHIDSYFIDYKTLFSDYEKMLELDEDF